jgi:DNA-binding response OmpR family regulator
MEYSTFRTHLAGLRRKLGPAGALIVNDRELGYRLVR